MTQVQISDALAIIQRGAAEILPEHHEKKIMIAFDHMWLKLSHLDWAYKYL